MNFFKKLFSKKDKANETGSVFVPGNNERVGISLPRYFDRLKKMSAEDETLLDGGVKMIESFYLTGAFKAPVDSPINHPLNLDNAEQFGFEFYCEQYGFNSIATAALLAYAFSDYMIKNLNMVFYTDDKPEFEYRNLTLKKDVNGFIVSIYPLEYSVKVLAGEKQFVSIVEQVRSKENQKVPSVDEILKQMGKDKG